MPRKPPSMNAETFKECLSALGWSLSRAAKELGICSRHRVWQFTTDGKHHRNIPEPVAILLKTKTDFYLRRKGL